MRSLFIRVLLALVACGLPVSAASIEVGFLSSAPSNDGFIGFTVYNETGPGQGCDASINLFVCTNIAFTHPKLVVTFADSSTITANPNDFAFTASSYLYGSNPGDDLSQSFLSTRRLRFRYLLCLPRILALVISNLPMARI